MTAYRKPCLWKNRILKKKRKEKTESVMSASLRPKQVWLGKIFALVRVTATSCLECFCSWQPCYLFGAELFFLSLRQHGEVQLAFINTNILWSQQRRLLRWGITQSRWIRQIRERMDVAPGSRRHWRACWLGPLCENASISLLCFKCDFWDGQLIGGLYGDCTKRKEALSVLLLLLKHLMCGYDWCFSGSRVLHGQQKGF